MNFKDLYHAAFFTFPFKSLVISLGTPASWGSELYKYRLKTTCL